MKTYISSRPFVKDGYYYQAGDPFDLPDDAPAPRAAVEFTAETAPKKTKAKDDKVAMSEMAKAAPKMAADRE